MFVVKALLCLCQKCTFDHSSRCEPFLKTRNTELLITVFFKHTLTPTNTNKHQQTPTNTNKHQQQRTVHPHYHRVSGIFQLDAESDHLLFHEREIPGKTLHHLPGEAAAPLRQRVSLYAVTVFASENKIKKR